MDRSSTDEQNDDDEGAQAELPKGEGQSYFNALRLSIGGDITHLPGVQIPLSLVEPTVILQVPRPGRVASTPRP